MDRDATWRWVWREREAVADLVESLNPDQLATPSLCDAWTVGDVAAHLTVSPTSAPLDVVKVFVQARGDFDRAVLLATEPVLGMPSTQVAQILRESVGSTRRPLGTTASEPLIDIVVHAQDMSIPLGLDWPTPVEAAAAAAQRIWTMGFPWWPRRRLRGLELVATDSDWCAGSGEHVRGRTADLLLLVSGRTARLDALDGPGAGRLLAHDASSRPSD